jgi:hypothetical protein
MGPDREDAALAPFFAEARKRDAETEVPSVLMARMMADADAVRVIPTRQAVRSGGLLEGIREAFGGWRGAATLAACAVAGIWIGVSDVSETASTMIWAGGSDAAAEDPVTAFFDLAAADT